MNREGPFDGPCECQHEAHANPQDAKHVHRPRQIRYDLWPVRGRLICDPCSQVHVDKQ
jgi:hypothetical protein